MFTRAIVRPPSANFAAGLTHAGLGKPDLARAKEQHARYCAALEQCGLALTHLPDDEHPDSTFVEDTAVVTERAAILTNPGAPSRRGEVAAIAAALPAFFTRIHRIAMPGTLDGGDVCQADDHFFIGLSERTNDNGARQLAEFLSQEGYGSSVVDIGGVHGLLHLKSGISWLGDGRLVLIEALAGRAEFQGYDIVRVAPEEEYAANFLRLGDHVVVSAGHPRFEARVRGFGYPVIALDMSEFRKMDGALSCLSLRF